MNTVVEPLSNIIEKSPIKKYCYQISNVILFGETKKNSQDLLRPCWQRCLLVVYCF